MMTQFIDELVNTGTMIGSYSGYSFKDFKGQAPLTEFTLDTNTMVDVGEPGPLFTRR